MMKEVTATLTSKGQITIPAEVRRRLDLATGDQIIFVLAEDGRVELRRPRFPTIESLTGIAGKLSHPMTEEEMLRIAYEDRFLTDPEER